MSFFAQNWLTNLVIFSFYWLIFFTFSCNRLTKIMNFLSWLFHKFRTFFFHKLLKNLHIFPHDRLTNCISFFCGQFMNWFFKWMTEEVCDIFYWQLTDKFHRFSDNRMVNFAENDNLKCFAEKLLFWNIHHTIKHISALRSTQQFFLTYFNLLLVA